MKTKLKRVQMLIEPDQHRILLEIARRRSESVAQVTRQVINLGIRMVEMDEAFTRREEALKKAEALRQAMRARRGQPLEIDVVDDLQQARKERDENLLSRGD